MVFPTNSRRGDIGDCDRIKSIANYIPALGYSITQGDTGGVLEYLGLFFWSILSVYLTSIGIWEAIGIAGKFVTPWFVLLQLGLLALSIGLAMWTLSNAGCL